MERSGRASKYTMQVVPLILTSIGVTTQPLTVTIDSTPPATPTGLDLEDASDSFFTATDATGTHVVGSNTDNYTNVTQPTFTGTAEKGSTVALFDGNTQVGTATAATLGIPLLGASVATPTVVTVTSGNANVVTVNGSATTTLVVNAGERVLQLPVVVSGAEGAALVTLEFNGQRRELIIVVGNPPPSELPAVTAPVVGVRIEQ